MKTPVYLDYNATTPIDPAVAEAMMPYIHHHFGNPSSSHAYGIEAKRAVEKARNQVAEMLHCQIDEIIFTSGGTESNNHAIKGAAYSYRKKGNHIITSAVEHPAVLEVCKYLEEDGFKITYIPVDENGLVDPAKILDAITPSTILISVMHANNEVGTIEPIKEIAKIAHEHDIIVHSDCAQSVGKIPVNVDELNVDLLSIAGHKVYAPKGIGALYIRSGIKLEKYAHGADHEMNRRAGTENVIEIAGLGRACELVSNNLEKYNKHMLKIRDKFETGLKEQFPDIRINSEGVDRLPNTSSVSFRNLEANTILSEMTDVAASAGAACHSDTVDVSPVLEAMKVPLEYAMGTIRFSFGRSSTIEEVEYALDSITSVISRLKPVDLPDNVSLEGDIKLTHYTHGLGCACKLRPQVLEEVLKKIPSYDDKNILVGTDTFDDAAVYKINDEQSIVQTLDFFTPIVDDPYSFGEIAAANSLSDIYAMGGKPLFALNIVGFPSSRLPVSVLEEILKGAHSKAREAGISIIGGHTVDDTEPKFGLAVTGIIGNDNIVRNSNAKPGDKLILTKPIGTGILSTAMKQGALSEESRKVLVDTMSELNFKAAEIMQKVGVNACTDVTGFGLLGHLLEMMKASETSTTLKYDNINFLPDVTSLAAGGIIPGGTRNNFTYTKPDVTYSEKLSEVKQLIINDAQTSGGLLISVSDEKADELLKELLNKGIKQATIIGTVEERREIAIVIE